jgi:hypothetical protein
VILLSRRSVVSVAVPLLGGAMWACGSSATAPAAAPTSCDDVEVLVAASDGLSSEVCGAPNHCELTPGLTTGLDLGTDPQLAMSQGRTFFINRIGPPNDLVFELHPKCGTPISRIDVSEKGRKAAVNPHDVAVAPDGSLFVTLYDVPRIAIMKDGRLDATIDLSSYDGDGNPQAESIRIVPVDGVAKAFVTLERLDDTDRLLSKQDSYMLRIDVATRVIEDKIVLVGRNPFNSMAEHAGGLFLAVPGNFDAADEPRAGIERFDAATSTTRLLVTEHDLGGSVSEVAVTDGCGAAIIAGPKPMINPTSLVTFDPATGQVLSGPMTPVLGPTPGYDLQALAWRGDSLYVGDRRPGAGGYPVHVFERAPGTCNLHEIASRSIELPQRPVALRPAR